MVFSVREIEALRLLGWCQYIRPAQLLRVVSETELSNLLAMKLIKYHGKSEALILTAEGRRLLAGTIWLPDTPRTYHADAVVRRLRLASLLLTAYQSGINVYATQPDELAEGNALFLTSAGRGRGRNPWGSTRTAALLHMGNLLCAAHYVCPDIGCLCPMDELSAFQNNTAKLPGTRSFLFCGESYSDIAALDSPEPQDRRFKNGENSSSRTADAAPAEPQNLRPSYTDKRKNDESYIEVSPSVTEGPDEEELTGILDACELSSFEPEMARIFETAIERLFYSDSFRVGNATLPQSRVRHRLHDLDNLTLRDTEQRLRANQERNIRNSIQYTMAVLFNCITEGESDLVVDPYLNSLGGP